MNVPVPSHAELDCWVAFAEGHGGASLVRDDSGGPPRCFCPGPHGRLVPYHPSGDWDLAAPIIEREQIQLRECVLHGEPAFEAMLVHGRVTWFASGPLPLVAAMRAYVRSRVPETVLAHGGFNERGMT